MPDDKDDLKARLKEEAEARVRAKMEQKRAEMAAQKASASEPAIEPTAVVQQESKEVAEEVENTQDEVQEEPKESQGPEQDSTASSTYDDSQKNDAQKSDTQKSVTQSRRRREREGKGREDLDPLGLSSCRQDRSVVNTRKPMIPTHDLGISKFAHCRNALLAYFEVHDPRKLQSKGDPIDKLLASYRDREVELFMKLENKYGAPVECAIPLEKLATPQRRRGGDDSGFTNCNPAPEEAPPVIAPKAQTPVLSLHGARRAALVSYFQEQNPDRVESVDKLFQTYRGREGELYKKLEEKYGVPVLQLSQSPSQTKKHRANLDSTRTLPWEGQSGGGSSQRRIPATVRSVGAPVTDRGSSFSKTHEKDARIKVIQPVLAKRDREVHELRRKVTQLETAKEELAAELDAAVCMKLSDKGDELESIRMQAQVAASENANEELQTLNQKVMQLKDELETSKQHEQQYQKLAGELNEKTARVLELEELLKASQDDIGSPEEAEEAAVEQLRQENLMLEEAGEELKQALTEAESKLKEKDCMISDLQVKLESLSPHPSPAREVSSSEGQTAEADGEVSIEVTE